MNVLSVSNLTSEWGNYFHFKMYNCIEVNLFFGDIFRLILRVYSIL